MNGAAIHASWILRMEAENNSTGGGPNPANRGEGRVRRFAGRLSRALRLGRPKKPMDGPVHLAAIAEGASDAVSPERAMLRNVLALRQARVADVMVPRADIVAVPADISLAELMKVFRSAAHSRLPVYGETLDEPRGMVHIRDFLDYLTSKAQESGRKRGKAGDETIADLGRVDLATPLESLRILRPVLYVPASMRAVALLRRMQATRTHMALIIDEYGGTDGLVSIEDLIEIVMGDIGDEHDDEEGALVTRVDDRTVVASARAELAEVSTMIGVDLSVGHAAEEVDTIGGLIVTLAGRVPGRGELIAGPGDIEFEIVDADPRRVKRVRIHLASSTRRQRRSREATPQATASVPPSAGTTPTPQGHASADAAGSPDVGSGSANEPGRE
jgi:CBS domain containing-hemolysin-like protein